MSAEMLFKRIFGFFFPNICISCGCIIEENRRICENCEKNLFKIDAQKACPFCGLEKPECDCRFSVYYFKGIASCYYNEGSAKNIVYNYKLGHRDYYANFLAEQMTADLNQKFKDIKFDYIVSVPSTLTSRFKKGFDHTNLLAKHIGKKLGVPVRRDVIGCKLLTPPQHNSNFKERFNNVKQKYYVKKRINAENVLLVDDIKTTGATLDACARELLYSGAKHIYCLTALAGTKKPVSNSSKKIKKITKKS